MKPQLRWLYVLLPFSLSLTGLLSRPTDAQDVDRDGHFGAMQVHLGCDGWDEAQFDALAEASVSFSRFGGGQEWGFWQPGEGWSITGNQCTRDKYQWFFEKGFGAQLEFRSGVCWGTVPDTSFNRDSCLCWFPDHFARTSFPPRDLAAEWDPDHGYSQDYYAFVGAFLQYWTDKLGGDKEWVRFITFREEPHSPNSWCGKTSPLLYSSHANRWVWPCELPDTSYQAANVSAYLRVQATVAKAAHAFDRSVPVYSGMFPSYMIGLGICEDAIAMRDTVDGWPHWFPTTSESAVVFYNDFFSYRPDPGAEAPGPPPSVENVAELENVIGEWAPDREILFMKFFMDSLGARYYAHEHEGGPEICDGITVHYTGNYWHIRSAFAWLEFYGTREDGRELPPRRIADGIFVLSHADNPDDLCEQWNEWDRGMGFANELMRKLTVARAEALEDVLFYKFDRPQSGDDSCDQLLALVDVDDPGEVLRYRQGHDAFRFLAGTVTSDYPGVPDYVCTDGTAHQYWFQHKDYGDNERFNVGVLWYADEEHQPGEDTAAVELPIDLGAFDIYDAVGTHGGTESPEAVEYDLKVTDEPSVVVFRGLEGLGILTDPPGATIEVVPGTHILLDAVGYYIDRDGEAAERIVTSDARWGLKREDPDNYELNRNVLTSRLQDVFVPVTVRDTIGDVSGELMFNLRRKSPSEVPPPVELSIDAGGPRVVYRPSRRPGEDPLPVPLTIWAQKDTLKANWTLKAVSWNVTQGPGLVLRPGLYLPPPDLEEALPLTITVRARVSHAGLLLRAEGTFELVAEEERPRKSPEEGQSRRR